MQQQLFEQGIASCGRGHCAGQEKALVWGEKLKIKKNLAKEKGVPLERVWLHPV